MNLRKAGWVVLLICGCSSPNDDAARSTADSSFVAAQAGDSVASGQKACALLTADDVTAVTGITHVAGVATHDYGGSTQCRYDRSDRTQGIMFTTHAQGDIENYRRVPGSLHVDKIGDAAVWNDGTAQLAVKNGGGVFSISFLTPPSNLQTAVDLARRALTRMQ